MPIVVFNKHCHPETDWCDEVVSVMRPNVLSNPFPITRNSPRAAVIQKYRAWLHEKLKDTGTPQYKEISRLALLHKQGLSIGLMCCCSPQPCHADIISRAVLHYASLAD